jgi:hypothetical protein
MSISQLPKNLAKFYQARINMNLSDWATNKWGDNSRLYYWQEQELISLIDSELEFIARFSSDKRGIYHVLNHHTGKQNVLAVAHVTDTEAIRQVENEALVMSRFYDNPFIIQPSEMFIQTEEPHYRKGKYIATLRQFIKGRHPFFGLSKQQKIFVEQNMNVIHGEGFANFDLFPYNMIISLVTGLPVQVDVGVLEYFGNEKVLETNILNDRVDFLNL